MSKTDATPADYPGLQDRADEGLAFSWNLEEGYRRLRRLSPDTLWALVVREEMFSALVSAGYAVESPPSVMISGDNVPVFFSYLVSVNDIWIRSLEEVQDGWIPWEVKGA